MPDDRARTTLSSERLKELRLQHGLGFRAASRKTGVSPSYWHNIETGKRLMSACIARRIAKAFQVNISWLLGEPDEKRPPDEALVADLLERIREHKQLALKHREVYALGILCSLEAAVEERAGSTGREGAVPAG